MSAHLLPCSGCARHVRASESACPFCGAAIDQVVPAPRAPTARLGRAATFAFGAAVATTLSVTGCDSTTPTTDSGVAPDAFTETDSGPAPTEDASIGDDGGGTPVDSGVDGGGPAPAYGAPPDDGGQIDSGGGAAPLYGAPPES